MGPSVGVLPGLPAERGGTAVIAVGLDLVSPKDSGSEHSGEKLCGPMLKLWLCVLEARLRGCMELTVEALSLGGVPDVVCATTPMSRLFIVGR